MYRLKFIAFLILANVIQPLFAADALTLASVQKQVLDNNPEIQAARADAQAAESMSVAAFAWPDPQIGVTFTDFPRPGLDFNQAGQKSLDFYQDIPFPGKTFLAYRTASADSGRSDARLRQVIAEQRFMADQAYWDLAGVSGAIRVLATASEALSRLVDLSAKRNRFGQVGRMEQLMDPMLKMEAGSMKSRMLGLRQDKATALSQLNTLMGEDPDNSLADPPEAVAPDFKGLGDPAWLDEALQNGPAVQVAAGDLKYMQAKRAETAAGWLPDFMLQYSATEMADGSQDGMAMAKVNLPFVWFWKPAAMASAANAEVRSSEAMLDSARREIRRSAQVEMANWKLAKDQLAIFDNEILPQAEKALHLGVSGYQSGSVGPADVLTALRSYVDMNLERLMLATQTGRSVAILSKLKGNTN